MGAEDRARQVPEAGAHPDPAGDRGAPAGGRRHGRSLEQIPGGGAVSGSRELDKLIHERVRLGIVSALAVNETLTFTELKGLLDTSDGNLSVHTRRLEDGGYVVSTKSFEDRHPKTKYRLTDAGRAALEAYLAHMERLIDAVKGR